MQGNLTQIQLPKIIHALNRQEESGILHFSKEDMTKRIYFGSGSMVFARSDQPGDRLGEYLVRSGRVSRSDLVSASNKMRASGQLLGATLVKMGLLSAHEVESRVAEQVQNIIYSLFTWDRGEYNFEQQRDPIPSRLTLDLPTIPIILEGVRRMVDAPGIRRALGDLERILSFSKDPRVIPHYVNLTPEEGFVLSRVDGASSVAEIHSISPIDEDATLRCLYGLLSGGFLEFGLKSRQVTPKKRTPPPLESSPGKKTPEPEGGATGAELTAEEVWVRDDILTKRAAIDKGTFYDWLDVKRTANLEEVKKAYVTAVKKYHPDRHRSERLKDLRRDLEHILTKLREAYDALTEPLARRRYDNNLRTEAPRGESLAKASPAKPKPDASEVAAKSRAERYYREASRYFINEDFHETVKLLEEAVSLDDSNAAYHRLLAQAMSKNPKWRKTAEEHFRAALAIEPFDVESLVGLGDLYVSVGIKIRARSMFAKAVALDPKNETTLEKLRSVSDEI